MKPYATRALGLMHEALGQLVEHTHHILSMQVKKRVKQAARCMWYAHKAGGGGGGGGVSSAACMPYERLDGGLVEP